jgi:predicted nucleotidyltransferase
MNTVQYLKSKNLISPPKWLPDNIMYETVTGSIAYGMSSDSSDYDVYGWCIPPKEDVFPHLRGEIFGFGKQIQRFEQFQQHGMHDPTALNNKGRTYDITIYSIVKYFQLCMENNPNMIDTLYTPYECVLHSTQVGKLVRDNRDIFLHKGCFHKFTGYAHSTLHKLNSKAEAVTKIRDIIEKLDKEYSIEEVENEILRRSS